MSPLLSVTVCDGSSSANIRVVRCRELEASLEQMKVEYEKCEEYWLCKLEDEREAFAEEQRAGDERLADLVAKIGQLLH